MRVRNILAAAAACGIALASGLVIPEAVGAATIGCGSVIKASVTLTADVGPCPGTGLTVGASNITLNLGGHTVTGTFAPTKSHPPANIVEAKGILLNNVSSVTVTNGSVTLFAVGIRVDGGSDNTITHMNVHDNIGKLQTDKANNGDGIALYASNHNLIDSNIVRHDGPWDGIATLSHDGSSGTDGASYNTISNNQIVDNNVPMLNESTGTPVWKQDNGVAITGPGSIHNVVDHNVITGSSVNGVQIFPSCINSYAGATAGLGCAGTVSNDYNVITNNFVAANGFGAPAATGPIGDGILILAMGPRGIFQPGHETVENNIVENNLRNGISISGGNGEDLFNPPNGNTQGANYACSNLTPGGGSTGVPTARLCGSDYNTVSNNTSSGNGDDGIELGPKSQFNTVTDNHVFNNHLDGIGLPLAVQYTANGMPLSNGSGGFVTIAGTAATDNTFSGNTGVNDGQWDGRDDSGLCDNTWSSNSFGTVNQPCVSG